jgi:hypothetical protein
MDHTGGHNKHKVSNVLVFLQIISNYIYYILTNTHTHTITWRIEKHGLNAMDFTLVAVKRGHKAIRKYNSLELVLYVL